MISAVNSMPSPLLRELNRCVGTDNCSKIITYLSRWLGKVTQGIRQFRWQYTVHLMWWLLGMCDSRPSQGHSDDSGQPGEQPLLPDNLEMDDINIGEVLSMFEVDNPPPPPPERPDHGPVAADSAPQATLDLLTACDMPGKGF